MIFNEFGSNKDKVILLMHGMLQDWHSMYEYLQPLETGYKLIIPAMDGMYDNSPDFTSFADQCRQIEEYIQTNYNGEILGVYGISQGATLMSELLARDKVKIKYAVLDGLYVAHQGRMSGIVTCKLFRKAQKNGGKFPKIMDVVMKLMGLTKDDYKMLDMTYWNVNENSMKRNLMENYTLHANPKIANTKTTIYLWCGEKERYARKSNRILKQYAKGCKETIFKGLGHGQMLYSHTEKLCKGLKKIFG